MITLRTPIPHLPSLRASFPRDPPQKGCSPANTFVSLSITRLHAIAAEVAIEATKVFFKDVRNVVGDEIFARFLDLLAVRTLVLVIDDTGSMGGMSGNLPYLHCLISCKMVAVKMVSVTNKSVTK